jgi:hypothetical protein
MIAQDIGFPVLFLKERCSYSYSQLRKKYWEINRQARARELYEISGLKTVFAKLQKIMHPRKKQTNI